MANITQQLTSISLDSRTGAPPGRRLLALTLVATLAIGSTFPGFALAGESDSEGEGTAPPVEVPVDPGFDPGGEEEGLEEAPATVDEEGGAVEAEAEVEIEVPPASEEVTGAATEAPVEAVPPPAVDPPPIAATPVPEAEPVQQEAAEFSEPVANRSIAAPEQAGSERNTAPVGDGFGEAAAPAGPTQQEAPPSSPQPVAAVAAPDPAQKLVGRDTYVVQPGDCLWHIAAAVLPAGSDTRAIEDKVAELWRMNEDRIGTGNPNLIYPGTELRLR
jgi:hypothetical protein